MFIRNFLFEIKFLIKFQSLVKTFENTLYDNCQIQLKLNLQKKPTSERNYLPTNNFVSKSFNSIKFNNLSIIYFRYIKKFIDSHQIYLNFQNLFNTISYSICIDNQRLYEANEFLKTHGNKHD